MTNQYLERRARREAREPVAEPVKRTVAAHQVRDWVGVPGGPQQAVRVDDVAEGARVGHHLKSTLTKEEEEAKDRGGNQRVRQNYSSEEV